MTRIENTAKTQITLGKNPDARKKIGLALGSGFARRLAHLGVIRALEEAGIEVDSIAGTSMGVLVGTIHAARKLDTLEATFRDFDWKKTASSSMSCCPSPACSTEPRSANLCARIFVPIPSKCCPKLLPWWQRISSLAKRSPFVTVM